MHPLLEAGTFGRDDDECPTTIPIDGRDYPFAAYGSDVNAKNVERFMAEHNGVLPAGVKLNERKKSIIIKRKDK